MAFGDSYSGVQSAALAEDQAREMEGQRSLATLLSGFRDLQGTQRYNQEFQYRSARDAEATQMQKQREAIAWASLLAKIVQDAQNADLNKQYFGLYKQDIEARSKTPSTTDLRKQEDLEKTGQGLAGAGLFESPEHVGQIIPESTPDQRNRFAAISAASRAPEEEQYQRSLGLAQALNESEAAGEGITGAAQLPASHWYAPWTWGSPNQRGQEIDYWRQRKQAADAAKTGADLKSVRKNPATGLWEPATTPFWRQQRQGAPRREIQITEWDEVTGRPVMRTMPVAPGQGQRAITPIPPAGTPPAGTAAVPIQKHSQWFYDRTRELVRMGMQVGDAARRAQAEERAVFE